ncbi:glutaminase [Ascidiimonas aurantiaca]|uniref:glutaminase n=1 Tax=Ascidiimonas aurantiaca TaxID=1685432 RepID=UPI0030ECD778
MNYQKVLNNIHSSIQKEENKGAVASYIPELSGIDITKFGMYLQMLDGAEYHTGAVDEKFSIQSISKVFSLIQATGMVNNTNEILKRVGVEPSGNPFNFLSLLELEQGIPRNPFINAGALVISDILISGLDSPKSQFLDFVRTLTGDHDIHYHEKVALSEKRTGHRNAAAAHLLRSFGNLVNDVDEVLDFYCYQCAIAMSCRQLAKAFCVFINKGKCLRNCPYLSVNQVKRINAIMLTCGFYDEAGEFAFEVGLPGKSGVGGGIVAVHPGKYSIATWAPGLNPKGNSKLGMQALELFTTQTGYSIF